MIGSSCERAVWAVVVVKLLLLLLEDEAVETRYYIVPTNVSRYYR